MGGRFMKPAFLLFMAACISFQSQSQSSVQSLHRAQKAITAVIVHDIFSPPVASRIYLYSNLAAYEALTVDKDVKSFYTINKNFPEWSNKPDAVSVDPELSSLIALIYTASRYVFSDSSMLDSMNNILKPYIHYPLFKASEAWGKRVSDSVFNWSKTDGYLRTRKLRRYSFGRDASSWKPTPPGYIAAVEPYWGQIRCIILDSLEAFRPPFVLPFSTDTASPFYKQAKEVYQQTKEMRKEDTLIAMYWDCNPFYLNTQGHLNFATKKLSPGGHWMSIAGIAAESSNANFIKSSKAYFATSVALFDGFISCWDEKYRSNTIRPETYINAYINESWRPLLQTPPFPEYTSGHSVISASAAEVLTEIFGNNFEFYDYTETGYGLPVRHFKSFYHASEEAAKSRFYGGIHYRSAIENGTVQGKKIGKEVVKKLVQKIK